MKRIPIVALALVAASVAAGAGSAQRSDLSGTRLSPQALAPAIGSTLDSRLAQIAIAVRKGGSGAALASARSQGLLVTQGKVHVVVDARPGHAAAVRKAVKLAHGDVVVARGTRIQALLPPRAVQKLAVSRFVARLQPVVSGVALSTVNGLRAGAGASSLAEMGGAAMATFGPESEAEATVPDAPADAVAVAGDGQVTVSFTPSASDGGSAIVYYTATAYPGGQSASSTGEPITVGGLTNGAEYTFTVTATNGIGTSGDSDASNAVTPLGSSRLDPDPPTGAPRPAIPAIPGTPVRANPHHNVPEF
jgi:hypothetical protein